MTMPRAKKWRLGILAGFVGVLLPMTLMTVSRFIPSGEVGSGPSPLRDWAYSLLWPSSIALPHLTGVYDPAAIRRAFMLSIAANGFLYGILGFAFGWLLERARKPTVTW